MTKAELARVLRQAERHCSERGVRLTAQRRTVLVLLSQARKPMTAYEVLDRMAQDGSRPAPPTVYRALDFLLRQGLIHKLESLHAYVGCSHPAHEHAGQFLICGDCGDVSELEDPVVARSLSQVGEAKGFRMERPVIELLGTCAECAHKKG